MTTVKESIKIGLSVEEKERFEAWLQSPEGQKELFDTLSNISKTIAEMRKTREIQRHLLVTLRGY